MKRWLTSIFIVLAVAVPVYAIYRVREKRAAQKREASYQSSFQRYSELLKPGMTREEVEGYFRVMNLKSQRMCCVSHDSGAWDDLVQIGKEEAPWFCSENNVYIAFQFAAQDDRHAMPVADPADTLKVITIYRRLEGCL